MMKKLLFLLAIGAIMYSCSKDSAGIPDPNFKPKIGSVPTQFNQKILIEQFTQATWGQCPKANLILDSLVRFNSDRVYGVSFHINDVMTDSDLISSFSGMNYYDSLFNPTSVYPSGMVNRHITTLADISPDQWAANTLTQLGHVPSCGVALEADNIDNGNLTLTVHVGFSAQMFGEYRIHTYIVQSVLNSNDPLYDQMNDFSSVGTTPDSTLSLYALDDTIHYYSHKYILKQVVSHSGLDGDPIPIASMSKGNDYTVNYNINLSKINTGNSYIIVFVGKYGTTLTTQWIENVQKVAFGSYKDWN